MIVELILFKSSLTIFSKEEEIMNETTQLIHLYLLDVHATMNYHRFQQIQFLMFNVGILHCETEEMQSS